MTPQPDRVAQVVAWQDIASAPADEPILAAVNVHNNRTGTEWWERHVIVIDSETGEITHDTDAGWAAGDYSHWMPLPDPPAIEAGEPFKETRDE